MADAKKKTTPAKPAVKAAKTTKKPTTKAAAAQATQTKQVMGSMVLTGQHFHNCVIMTDFNCGTANAQVEMRFRNVFLYTSGQIAESAFLPTTLKRSPWVAQNGPKITPAVINLMDIPFGNIDNASFSLYTFYRALGKSTRPNIFVHVTDPGVGFGDDRSILVTDIGNVFIGPNNGSLGMMVAYFASRDIAFTLHRINKQKVVEMERIRMQQPGYHMPSTFHGRDLMAVVAGMIAGGIAPAEFALDEKSDFLPIMNRFSADITTLPLRVGEKVPFFAFRDNTYGNLKTNISAAPDLLHDLIRDKAVFRVEKPAKCRLTSRKIKFKANHVFADTKTHEPLLYLGSTFSPNWDERFVELAINLGNAGNRLDMSHMFAEQLFISRLA